MQNKITIAVVDDCLFIHDDLKEFYCNSSLVEIKYNYTNSADFIKTVHTIEFDLCILDINMPGLNGISVAQMLGQKPFIFLTASEDRLSEALQLNPIDVVTKPFLKKRLDQALEKATKLLLEKVEYAFFNVAENKHKVKIRLADILFVLVDDIDPRNKQITMKGDVNYTLMGYSFNELKSFAPHLLQVNRQNMVAIECIHAIGYDVVKINRALCSKLPEEVTLSASFKEEVSKRVFYT
jgi:two-component system LytT family response regulator